ncbi:MAG: hypothetical protein ACTSYW_00555 [Candidatus Heimdallarchaeota archaeon]
MNDLTREEKIKLKTNCKGCGCEMPFYAITGNRHGLMKKQYCNVNCRSKYTRREKRKQNPEYREKINLYEREYRKNNPKIIKLINKKQYQKRKNNPEYLKSEYEKRRTKKYRDEHNIVSSKWEKNNPEKIRETKCLRLQFKTSKLPISIKKQYALAHLSNRIIGLGYCKSIEKNKIKNILKHIENGETHEAYK